MSDNIGEPRPSHAGEHLRTTSPPKSAPPAGGTRDQAAGAKTGSATPLGAAAVRVPGEGRDTVLNKLPGVILSGLAVGAILGTPVAAAASPAIVGEAASASGQPATPPDTVSAAIREQFQTSFTPGAVAAGGMEIATIICET